MSGPEPTWLDPETLLILHDEQIAEHGGLSGVRDEGALEAALARPMNKFAYGESDLYALAAAYGFGLARNHPFSDGNKRSAALASFLFLEINGLMVPENTDEVEAVFLALAAGGLSEEGLAEWLRKNSTPA